MRITVMNETEWMACTDPWEMLEFLEPRASNRKLQLFAVACCRRIDPFITDERSRGAVDAAALCASFGGGGHIRAAGAEIERSMEEAMRIVLAAAKEAILAASSQH